MENSKISSSKISRKALKSLLKDSMRDAIGKLDLPKVNRKMEKLLDKSSKKLASEYAQAIKKKNQAIKKEKKKSKKMQKSLIYVEDVLTGKNRKGKKVREEKTQSEGAQV